MALDEREVGDVVILLGGAEDIGALVPRIEKGLAREEKKYLVNLVACPVLVGDAVENIVEAQFKCEMEGGVLGLCNISESLDSVLEGLGLDQFFPNVWETESEALEDLVDARIEEADDDDRLEVDNLLDSMPEVPTLDLDDDEEDPLVLPDEEPAPTRAAPAESTPPPRATPSAPSASAEEEHPPPPPSETADAADESGPVHVRVGPGGERTSPGGGDDPDRPAIPPTTPEQRTFELDDQGNPVPSDRPANDASTPERGPGGQEPRKQQRPAARNRGQGQRPRKGQGRKKQPKKQQQQQPGRRRRRKKKIVTGRFQAVDPEAVKNRLKQKLDRLDFDDIQLKMSSAEMEAADPSKLPPKKEDKAFKSFVANHLRSGLHVEVFQFIACWSKEAKTAKEVATAIGENEAIPDVLDELATTGIFEKTRKRSGVFFKSDAYRLARSQDHPAKVNELVQMVQIPAKKMQLMQWVAEAQGRIG